MRLMLTCIALYDWPSTLGMSDVYSTLESFLEQNSFKITQSHILVAGWPKAKKIAPAEVGRSLVDGGLLTKSFEGEFAKGQVCIEFLLRADSSSLLYVGSDPANEEILVRLLKDLTSKLHFSYGYLFNIAKQGAALYAVGITHWDFDEVVGESDQDADGRWFSERVLPGSEHRYRDRGFFRDIYPCNLLNASHLNALVDGVRLEDKIERAGWGELFRISDTNWLWKIHPSTIQEVRGSIARSNLLV